FEWPSLDAVLDKLDEEKAELQAAVKGGDCEEIESEIGDLLFTIVNIARWCKVEPEEALRKMVNRFMERFHYMEAHARGPLGELSAVEWDALWEASKNAEAVHSER